MITVIADTDLDTAGSLLQQVISSTTA